MVRKQHFRWAIFERRRKNGVGVSSAFCGTTNHQMKKNISISLLAILFAVCVRSAEADGTHSTNDTNYALARIPDATHEPVRVTNTVTIAGEPVTYSAETGMLPVLKPDG